jgi:hypothetical protein
LLGQYQPKIIYKQTASHVAINVYFAFRSFFPCIFVAYTLAFTHFDPSHLFPKEIAWQVISTATSKVFYASKVSMRYARAQ